MQYYRLRKWRVLYPRHVTVACYYVPVCIYDLKDIALLILDVVIDLAHIIKAYGRAGFIVIEIYILGIFVAVVPYLLNQVIILVVDIL